MNVKKYLDSVAKADRESLKTKEDDLFLEKLFSESVPKKSLNKKMFFAIGISISALLVLVVCLSVFLPFKRETLYLSENTVQAPSSLEELNRNLKNFQINIGQEAAVYRVYDSVSGDTLYYTIDETSSGFLSRSFNFVAVTNAKYHYEYSTLGEDCQSAILNGIELKYRIEFETASEFDIYTIEGEMQIGADFLYITYHEIVLSGMNDSFLQGIEEIIQLSPVE